MDKAPESTPLATPSKVSSKDKAPEPQATSALRGTRASRRSRGIGEEWQEVPAEWLNGEGGNAASGSKGRNAANGSNGNKRKLPTDEDDESDLSELTDEEEHEASMGASISAGKPTDGMEVEQVS